MGMLWTRSEESYLLGILPATPFIGRWCFNSRSGLRNTLLALSLVFRHDDVFMYYCSCLHNWQWRSARNRRLASPPTTDQRLALKWLPHRKCMAKVWNVITALPYFQMKHFSDIFSGSSRATKWTEFEVHAILYQWVIKCFWGLSSTEDSAQCERTIGTYLFTRNFLYTL